ncbi:MAG TPA: SDR family oxidoreductase [Gemmataceae bacterium]|nr:SDR family oxidoreductase [Gemmataceae bacterium]
MTRNLQGRRILITGASSGIGKELAQQLASLGANLVLAARNEEKLNALAASLPGKDNILVVPTDVTRAEDRERLLDRAVQRFGGLDVLINNAGIASWAHFADSTEEIMRQVMEVNFFAPAELIRKAIPILVNGIEPAIVNVASMCGRRAMPAWSEYSASKYALCGLTEALRGELARFDIDILLIIPGLTRSEFSQHFLKSEGKAKIEYDKGMPPADVAARIIRSLQKNKTETWIGRDTQWMLRVNRWFPRFVDYMLGREVKKLYQNTR